MRTLSTRFESLSDRAGFNASVRHIKGALEIVERVAAKENLADVLAELVEQKRIESDDLLPMVSMILGEKYPYRSVAMNLPAAVSNLATVADSVSGWNGIDLVLVYHHPDLGVLVVNPKNKQKMASIDRVNRSELAIVWAGRFAKEAPAAILESAAQACIDLLSGKNVKPKKEFLSGDCAYRQPKEEKEPKAAAPRRAKAAKLPPTPPAEAFNRGKAAPLVAAPVEPVVEHKAAVEAERAIKPGSRMTPMYSVPVSNELFHNGNVEAWKRIIDSYRTKNPGLEVLVYYDGERIANLNALFKWGKVKHGSTIQFAVVGDDIKDVAKLQRYLRQGASPQFEAFLRGPVNAVLPLF